MTTDNLWASASIAPASAVPLAGRGGPPRFIKTTGTDVEANVIAFPMDSGFIALVALDALFGSTVFKNEVRKALSPSTRSVVHDLIFVASHTHNAPSLDPDKPGLGIVSEPHFKAASVKVAKCVETAVAAALTERDLMLERGQSSCTLNAVRRRKTLAVNSRWPFFSFGVHLLPNRGVQTPQELDVIVARDERQQPKWLIWSWACHATNVPDLQCLSADFPGAVRDRIRSALNQPQLPVVYLPGFAGDVRGDALHKPVPVLKRIRTPFARPFAESTPENFAFLCRGVGDAAEKALSETQPIGRLGGDAKIVRNTVDFRDVMDTPIDGAIGLTRLDAGPLAFLFMGAETCSPYLKKLSPLLPDGALLTGYADDVPCYLPVDSQIAEGGYEVSGFRHSFGLPGAYFAKVEDIICDHVKRLEPRSRD